MPAIHAEHRYTHDADTVWRRIRDFGDLKSWLPGVDDCSVTGTGVGAMRTVRTATGGQVIEELIAYDETRRRFSYRIVKAPGVREENRFVATVSVEAIDGGCLVTWQADVDAAGAPAERMEAARQGAEKMYRFCLAHLAGLLDG